MTSTAQAYRGFAQLLVFIYAVRVIRVGGHKGSGVREVHVYVVVVLFVWGCRYTELLERQGICTSWPLGRKSFLSTGCSLAVLF